jgi:hypothetical protein
MRSIGLAFGVFVIGVAALLIAVAPSAHAQSSRLSFDVASIQASAEQSVGDVGTIYTIPGGRFTANSVLLRVLIFNAYDLKEPDQLIGGPDWINTIRWSIEAQAAGNPDRGAVMRMLRSLLEDRFKLTVHRETRELAAPGSKLESSKRLVQVLVIDSVQKPSEN